MSRFFDSGLPYDYDYSDGRSTWDTRTFIAVDNDDDDAPSHYARAPLRRPAASVIGYGDFDGHSPRRTRLRPGTKHRDRERDRDRDTARAQEYPDRDRAHRDAPYHHHHHHAAHHHRRTSLKPSLSTLSGLTLTLTDRDKELLKQRLCPDRRRNPPGSSSSSNGSSIAPCESTTTTHHHPFTRTPRTFHPRARSLSLSRLSLSDSSLDPDDGGHGDDDGFDFAPRGRRGRWADRDFMIPPAAPAVPGSVCMSMAPPASVSVPPPPPPSGAGGGPASGYYLHERLGGPAGPGPGPGPRVGWASRPASRSVSREREVGYAMDMDGEFARDGAGYERGYGRCASLAGEAGEVREEDLRARLGGMETGAGRERLANPRVPSVGRRRRRRSPSRERFGGGNGVGAAAGARASSTFRGPAPQYNQVHALILTWSFHDLRAEDYTAPPAADYVSLEEETARLRATLEGYGYAVHEFLIPMHRSVESVKAKLKQFCRLAADDTLLIVYYHGHGALDDDNELVFSSHDHPENAEWSKAAAADLYAALLSGDTCHAHGRRDRYQDLLKKYERYRPVASLKWDAIRGPILSAPCDVLLVLDCCAAGGASLRHINWQPPPGAERYTKHLFAACGFESSTSDDMTAAMCEVLDEWVPPRNSSVSSVPRSRSRSGSVDAASAAAGAVGDGDGAGGVVGGGAGGPVGGGQFLTTKRLHQLMEHKLQKRSVGSQPIFKQLLPQDPEQYITLPNLRRREPGGERTGRRGYILA